MLLKKINEKKTRTELNEIKKMKAGLVPEQTFTNPTRSLD
jgi:hypothetical protein